MGMQKKKSKRKKAKKKLKSYNYLDRDIEFSMTIFAVYWFTTWTCKKKLIKKKKQNSHKKPINDFLPLIWKR